MNKILLFGSQALLLLSVLLFLISPTLAQLQLPSNNSQYRGEKYFESVKPSDASQGGAFFLVDTVIKVVNQLKILLMPAMIAFIVYIGVRIILANGSEDEIGKHISHFIYIVIGVILLALADQSARIFALIGRDETSSFISDGKYVTSANGINIILDTFLVFARYVLGGIAVFFSVKSGVLIIFAGTADDEVGKQKEVFLWGFIGFIIIMASTSLVRRVIFPISATGEQVAPSVSEGIGLIVSLINLLLGILGGLAVVSLVAGGVMYAASAGSTDRSGKATQLIYGSLLGLVIAYSAYTIVAEFIPQHKVIGNSIPDFASPQGTLDIPQVNSLNPVIPTAPSGSGNSGSP